MQEEGRVISVKENMASIQIEMSNACQQCQTCHQDRSIILEADNSIGAKVGQKVKLETKIIAKVRGIIFYLTLPPLLLVFGIITGSVTANYFNLSSKVGEIIGLISGLLLCALSLLLAYWLDKKDKKDKKLFSKIIEIIGDEDENSKWESKEQRRKSQGEIFGEN